VTEWGLIRVKTSDCKTSKPFCDNQDFFVVSGSKYYKDGILDFQTRDDSHHNPIDGFYRTFFGPWAPHNSVIFANNDFNMSHAFKRLTGCRYPCRLRENIVRERQRRFIRRNAVYFEQYKLDLSKYFPDISDHLKMIEELAELPHPKRKLRLRAIEEMKFLGNVGDKYMRKERAQVKMKPFEWAKSSDDPSQQKFPRCIGDLGVAASLEGALCTSYLKEGMYKTEYIINGIKAVFVKSPEPTKMEEVFRELRCPTLRGFFVYFSDDACFSIHTSQGVKRYNMDISSCDASHTEDLFMLWASLFPPNYSSRVNRVISQCRMPVVITSRTERRRKVVLQSKSVKLLSGSTMTTSINNLANLLICISLATSVIHGEADIIEAALSAGYKITCEDCTVNWRKLQFLKMSPCLDIRGELRAVLNIGVFFRLFGNCKGDLIGRGKWEKRAELFNGGLLQGCYPRTRFTLVNRLRSRYSTTSARMLRDIEAELAFKGVSSNAEIDDDELYQRYDLTSAEIDEVNNFASTPVGCSYSSSAISKILFLDYGIGEATWQIPVK